MKRLPTLSVLTLAFGLVVAGCGTSAAPGTSTYTSEAGGFSLDVPDSFRIIDLEQDDLPALLAGTDLSENAQLLIANTLTNASSGFLLWAFDFDAGNEVFIPNLNIVRLARNPNETIEFLEERIETDYSGVAGADVLIVDELEGANGAGLLVEALFPINGIDDDSHAFQFISFTDDYTYTITYSWIGPSDTERRLAVDSFTSFTVEP